MSARRLEARDADAAARVHAAAFDAPWSAVEFADLLADPAVAGVCCDGETELDGFILLRVAADEAEILTLAVAPDRRRRGTGVDLIEAAAATARERGAVRLFLEVGADNDPALRLYGRTGFVEVGRRKAYYHRPGGGRADAVVMKRSLNTGAG
jgi:ribosomal-protein-alanine N-acetyltransferase